MKVISGISSDYNQKFKLTLTNGNSVDCALSFYPNQVGWYISFAYEGIVCSTPLRLTVCPNILREYKNRLPFGIGCSTTDNNEVMYVDDFESGRASLLLLDENDVDYVEDTLYAKVR